MLTEEEDMVLSIIDLFLIGVSLSMDAFAVSVCKGLSVCRMKLKHALICGIYFGGFQALMPLLGYLLGTQFSGIIEKFSHWIAFLLLAVIGINMIQESSESCDITDASFAPAAMLPLAVATSIDALAVGVGFAALKVNIVWAVSLIGITTFLFSAAGVKIGNVFGMKYRSAAERAGGVILVLMGVKILLQGLGIF